MNDIVEIWEDEPMAGTYLIAQGFDREHRIVTDLIKKYEKRFTHFSNLKTRKLKSTGGRAATEIMLTENQTMFLGVILRNNEATLDFKTILIDAFSDCRKQLGALTKIKSTKGYIEARGSGILVRKEATDRMKEFVEYAKDQGSKNADRYYSNITRMLNSLLFIVNGKYKNLREVMTVRQLMTISSAENIVDNALKMGISRKKYYKDVYKDVKSKVAIFAELHGQSEVIKQLELE